MTLQRASRHMTDKRQTIILFYAEITATAATMIDRLKQHKPVHWWLLKTDDFRLTKYFKWLKSNS